MAANQEERQKQLQDDLKMRWEARRPEREEIKRNIKAAGVLAAAGLKSALGRVAHMTVSEGRLVDLEAVIGDDDSDNVNFLDRGVRAARAVCRMSDGRTPMGSGFLVAPGIVMTNHHVIPDAESARTFIAEFDVQLDIDDNPLRPKRFATTPELFVTSQELDFTFVSIAPVNREGDRASDLPWLPLEPRRDKILEGEPVVVIQHPAGGNKRVCLFESAVTERVDPYLQYTTDTDDGSSGSPAFNRSWQVIALHHASVDTGEKADTGRRLVVNEGIRTSVIMEALRTGDGVQGDGASLHRRLTDTRVNDWGGRPTALVAHGVTEPGLEARATKIRRRDADHYVGRRGYDVDFLGVPVPIAVSDDDVATLIEDGAQSELKYLHYSAVMCASRRLAFYTAVNINGSSIRRLGRKDRDPDAPGTEPEAAADVWYFDPRIEERYQLGPEVYDDTVFAFGHMTRRLDPVWGSTRDTRIANDDTFHMTNCAPQHQTLNSGSWATLEDAVLKFAEEGQRRVTVVTGPVLSPSDPDVLGVACPTAYYKVVAWKERDAIRAAGFMQWQTKFVDEIRRNLEDLGDSKATFHVPIADIARVTSVDFGPLSDRGVEVLPAGGRKTRVTAAQVVAILGS